MKSNFNDLYELFEDYLFENLLEDENEDTFVANVVALYMKSVKEKKGIMPQAFLEDIKEDTAEIVYDMLLKKTYGYFSLHQYRMSIINKKIV